MKTQSHCVTIYLNQTVRCVSLHAAAFCASLGVFSLRVYLATRSAVHTAATYSPHTLVNTRQSGTMGMGQGSNRGAKWHVWPWAGLAGRVVWGVARTLRSWVQIPLGAWMFVFVFVFLICSVLCRYRSWVGLILWPRSRPIVELKLSHYTPRRRLGGEVWLLLVLDHGTRWRWVVSVTPRPSFIPGERTPGTHCTGGWVGFRAGLDTEARGKILCLCRGSNLDRPALARHYTDWATRRTQLWRWFIISEIILNLNRSQGKILISKEEEECALELTRGPGRL
jgi:hypothetical protein